VTTMALPGELTEKQKTSGTFSELAALDCGGKGVICSYIGPQACDSQSRQCLPTVFAIGGELQFHVSLFFRSWRAEKRGWQVIAPMRADKDVPMLFEKSGVDLLVQLLKRLTKDVLPHDVEGGRFHLIGTSNGGAAALAVAARVPDRVASLTLVTGFMPDCVKTLGPLREIRSIRLLGSKQDWTSTQLELVQKQLEDVGADPDVAVIKKATHSTIGEHIDKDQFWDWLEEARKRCAEMFPKTAPQSSAVSRVQVVASENTVAMPLRPPKLVDEEGTEATASVTKAGYECTGTRKTKASKAKAKKKACKAAETADTEDVPEANELIFVAEIDEEDGEKCKRNKAKAKKKACKAAETADTEDAPEANELTFVTESDEEDGEKCKRKKASKAKAKTESKAKM